MAWQGQTRTSTEVLLGLVALGLVVTGALSAAGGAPQGKGAAVPTAGESRDGREITVMLPGKVPLVLVKIPAGTFMMGSPSGERGRSDDETQHQVTLTHHFYLGKNEVTQGQWQAIMGNNPSSFGQSPDFPVDQVSWNDITGTDGFLARLNRHLASTGQPGAGEMRLPTEAEWERAARGGTATRFSYGDVLDCKDGCSRTCQIHPRYMWWCGEGPAPVGGKKPNPYGLYDVHGNVREWVQDCYGPYSSTAQTDPKGPASGSGRIARGGGVQLPPVFSRSAARGLMAPNDRDPHTGFRLARSL